MAGGQAGGRGPPAISFRALRRHDRDGRNCSRGHRRRHAGLGRIMPTQGPSQGSLAGTYGGASGEIDVGIGVGANALWGGSGRSVALQPISVEGSVGLDVTLGVSALTLQWVP
jgi:hypothetical protein